MSEENSLLNLSNALADAAANAGNSIVTVDARNRFPASGIVYAENLILTADHIVEREEKITITDSNGDEKIASLAGRDPGSDLALLRLEDAALTQSPVANDAPRIGEIVLALGRPSSNGVQASLGVVSAIGGTARRVGRGKGRGNRRGRRHKRHHGHRVIEEHIRTDAIPYPGFSGGPLVNASGDMIGINTSGLVRGISLAIPVARAWQIAKALSEHGSVKRGYLGIRSHLTPISEEQQTLLKREQEAGLLIVWVEKDSPVAQAGLIVGDILVGIDETNLSHHEELQRYLISNNLVGQQVAIEILRGGQPMTINVTVSERTA